MSRESAPEPSAPAHPRAPTRTLPRRRAPGPARRPLTVAVLVGVVAGVGLTGCGGADVADRRASRSPHATASSPDPRPTPLRERPRERTRADLPAAEIYRQAMADLREVTSVRMVSQKQAGDDVTVRTDLAVDEHGDCQGEVTTRDGHSRSRAEFLIRDRDVWVRSDDSEGTGILRDLGPALDRANGRYVHGSTLDARLAELVGLCDLDVFGGPGRGGPEPELTKGPPERRNGQRAVPLTGRGEDGAEYTLYVAVDGPAHLVEVRVEGASAVEFSDYDEPVATDTPGAYRTVELTEVSP